jgi:sugar phosphate isomerase/epimerase
MSIRLGGPVFEKTDDPEAWARAVCALGYRAATCPLSADASDDVVRGYVRAAERADVVIAEVGAWSNPMSDDAAERKAALERCTRQLALAERVGANCCVNIAGACGPIWDGPYPANLTRETFDRIVETTRGIIDAVKPTRTFYTLEAMPWMYPTGPDSYLDLLRAIDRTAFGVHLDPVNMISSPQHYFDNASLIRECFAKLGPHIKNCHAKDTLLRSKLTVHLDEVAPGQGALDYRTFLRELDKLADPRVGLILEHLHTPEEYAGAAAYIRSVAAEEGITF